MLNRARILSDKAAILISTACTVHCLLIPVVIVAFPVIASTFFGDESFHAILLWIILPTSLLALTLGCRAHKDVRVIFYGLIGLGFMVTAALAGHSLLSEFGERGITVAGSAFLILGHVRNQHLCSHDHCHDHDAITESHHHN
jgi:hypothetical protein